MTGLSLEGGAMRGLFSCGITDVWLEHGIEFDAAAGISAGAVFGCNFKSRQVGRAVRYNKRYGRDKRYCSIWSMICTGDLYGVEFCYHTLPDELDIFDRETFKNNPMKFYIGATDVETGKILYHECSDGGREDLEWMRASASMPIVSRPVPLEGHLLLDGGIVEAVPLPYMEHLGYTRNVVILTQPKGYRKTKSSGTPLIRMLLHKYPKMAEAMSVRYLRYNEQIDAIDRKADRGEILAIYPDESLGIKRTESNPDELERVYQLGRRKGQETLNMVRDYLV
ncbi:MAG: patatin family protein [Clostridia bacterium]|nr:patatin family protein [Clostridia bacterium]